MLRSQATAVEDETVRNAAPVEVLLKFITYFTLLYALLVMLHISMHYISYDILFYVQQPPTSGKCVNNICITWITTDAAAFAGVPPLDTFTLNLFDCCSVTIAWK